MKIYLLMMLIGTLLTAIRFTFSAQNSNPKRFPIADCSKLKPLAQASEHRQRQYPLPGENILHLFIRQC